MERDSLRSNIGGGVSATRDPAARPHGRTPPAPAPPRPQDDAPADALKEAARTLGELREYVGYFVAAKLDGIKLTFRRIGVMAAVGVIGLLAAGAIVGTAAVLFCVGLAQAVATLLAHENGAPRTWLGNLIVGLLLLLVIGGGAWYMMSRLTGSSRKATVKKYELRRQRERADFGHDVFQRASERRPGDDQPR
jgi:hypothetical protein